MSDWNDQELKACLEEAESNRTNPGGELTRRTQSALAWKLHTDLGMDHQDALTLVSTIYWGGWNSGWDAARKSVPPVMRDTGEHTDDEIVTDAAYRGY